MNSSSSIVERLLDDISQNDGLRVWSVIITVFGDAIVPRGGTVGLSALQTIMGGMRIEPNAVRTAMSRLARDRWVNRQRNGRQSFYALAPEGYALFESASQRIYGTSDPEWSGLFELVLRPEDGHKNRSQFQNKMRQLGFGSPMPDVYVRPKGRPSDTLPDGTGSIVLESNRLTDGMSLETFLNRCWPIKQLSIHYERLERQFSPVLNALETNRLENPFDCLVLRILLIHEWRKLVLRNVDLPDEFRPGDDAAIPTKVLVGKVYKRLFAPSEAFLDRCHCDPDTNLPDADKIVKNRFKT